MHALAYNKNTQVSLALLGGGAGVNTIAEGRTTPLLIALLKKHPPETIRALIFAGADPNYMSDEGESVLSLAIYTGQPPESIEALIEAGAKVNMKTTHERTSLMIAAKWSTPEVVKTLLSKKASVSAADKNGNTSLLYAIENERYA